MALHSENELLLLGEQQDGNVAGRTVLSWIIAGNDDDADTQPEPFSGRSNEDENDVSLRTILTLGRPYQAWSRQHMKMTPSNWYRKLNSLSCGGTSAVPTEPTVAPNIPRSFMRGLMLQRIPSFHSVRDSGWL